ncbi:UNKNOWN [Stylonychia lemnae]|uniref:Uncharacterized protein n=1 Tax=Stylonychia lemnae TaxID=5949 RepID=A0A078A1L7_STYLE|nr:UNKNOWN [Stylonychia lemnae]|eukprot:CDW74674.1 UNKNOWN [Stylonychia lemnae]
MPPRSQQIQELTSCIKLTIKKCTRPITLLYLCKSLFKSVFGIRNLKTLLYRFLTIMIVIAHYTIVEKINYEDFVHNEWEFMSFIVVWHVIFMNLKIIEESRRKKNEEHLHMMVVIVGVIAIYTLSHIILTPILAWLDYESTRLQSSYFTYRYIWMFFYILFNSFINIFPLVNNFMFFLSDGIILTQLTSLYLFNEFSMSALLTSMPVLFVIQNHGLIKGIKNFTRDETNSKLSFVRLIGRHDAVFLFVIYTMFTFLFNLVDTLANNYVFVFNLWYTVYALYVFGKLMDNKKINTLKLFSFFSILLYGLIYCYTLQYQINPFPERVYPLYNPNPINATQSTNSTIIDSNQTISINSTNGNDL